MNDDDKDQPLLQLRRLHDASIVSQLVEIGQQQNQQEHIKFRYLINELQCLRPRGTRLYRHSISAFRERRYVALSYTWDPSEHEDGSRSGKYVVENWAHDGHGFQSAEVRDRILYRALRYMRQYDVDYLWIDRHCIHQDTCGNNSCTRHFRCRQKRDALQAMDLVYQRSKHPVALLGRPVTSEAELRLLGRIIQNTISISNREEARAALALLYEITQDLWWTRAWTFQENYRGGGRMRLLIRHNRSLESLKLQYRRFGKIPGELSVRAATFSEQATRLCLDLRNNRDLLQPDDEKHIDDVLRAAGKYTILLDPSSCMTPTVIADIEARGIRKPWDRLALVANCCKYPIRLDGRKLAEQGCSLSLSILAMCLLNGEILDNSTTLDTNNNMISAAAGLTTSQLLEKLVFRKFRAPEDHSRPLTFNKSCRLAGVELTAGGIAARGHLWELGPVVNTARFGGKPYPSEPDGQLTLEERACILQLALELENSRDKYRRPLAQELEQYLDEDAANDGRKPASLSFKDKYLHDMFVELAAAIRAGEKLRLGRIWDRTEERPGPYSAVFVWPDGTHQSGEPAFVFTSAWPGNGGSEIHDANDIDRHVTLQVEVENSFDPTPRLRVSRWLLGTCFWYSVPRTRVIFPWPRALQEI